MDIFHTGQNGYLAAFSGNGCSKAGNLEFLFSVM